MADERNLTERGVDNSLKGKIKHAAGHVKDALGGLTGDKSMQAEGKVDQLKGKLQDGLGAVQRDLDRPARTNDGL
ncbi:MAG: CsbD family protein [Gemmatimonadetes bacterium]|nr:CsbD family protein [Gemmatimonadota bacterium]